MIAEGDTVDVTVPVENKGNQGFLEGRNTVADIAHPVWPERLPGEASWVLMDRGFGVEVPEVVDIVDMDSRKAKEREEEGHTAGWDY